MKKITWIGVICIALISTAVAYAMGNLNNGFYEWNYKMTVTVETPEGEVSGSAVHRMVAGTRGSFIPEAGNPAKVNGEAVVVDLKERGVLFALISHESDNRFRDAFPIPGQTDGQGGATEQGIKYHSSLPVGARGSLDPKEPPGYPKLVTFTDMNDPKSVTLAQEWKRDEDGRFSLKADHMEELFGQGVKLKEITLEITDEPVTWGVVDEYLPSNFDEEIVQGWKAIPREIRIKIVDLVTFKQGSK